MDATKIKSKTSEKASTNPKPHPWRTTWSLRRLAQDGCGERIPPTLAEVAQARPRRGAGAPARCLSHKAAILALLRERGAAGVLGSELYDFPDKFGRSPRNRIAELRAEGYLISGQPHGSSDWRYFLFRDNAGFAPMAQSPYTVPSTQVSKESDFMRRRRIEETAAMPLFASVTEANR